MSRFLSIFTLVFLLADIIGAGIGNAIARDARTVDMPQDIVYEIQLTGVWPDRYYASAYDMPAPSSAHIDQYWTFEPSKFPLSPPVWVHHLNEITLQEVNNTVNQITR